MFSRISKNSKRILAILSQHRSPNQIAWGVAFGITLGLLPKDNLITISMVCFLAFLRVNQIAGIATAIFMSMLADWFAPASIKVGSLLLNQPSITYFIRRLYDLPIMPWTRLENPLIPGGILIGLFSALPTFLVCSLTFSKAKMLLDNDQLQQIANEAIQYRKVVLDQSASRRERPATNLRVLTTIEESAVLNRTDDAVEIQEQAGLEKIQSEVSQSEKKSGHSVSSDPKLKDTESARSIFPRLVFEESSGSETILRETVIEVVRFRRPVTKDLTPTRFPNHSDHVSVPIAPGSSMSVANMPFTISNANVTRVDNHFEDQAKHTAESTAAQEKQPIYHPTNGEESLRYLISHINGTREQSRKVLGKSHDVA